MHAFDDQHRMRPAATTKRPQEACACEARHSFTSADILVCPRACALLRSTLGRFFAVDRPFDIAYCGSQRPLCGDTRGSVIPSSSNPSASHLVHSIVIYHFGSQRWQVCIRCFAVNGICTYRAQDPYICCSFLRSSLPVSRNQRNSTPRTAILERPPPPSICGGDLSAICSMRSALCV